MTLTTTHGKKATEAKEVELAGWSYPKHLAGRAYGLVNYPFAFRRSTNQRAVFKPNVRRYTYLARASFYPQDV